MDDSQLLTLGVSDFLSIVNQTLDGAYPAVYVEGEVESYKLSQGKFVFFNLKDAQGSVGCFMMAYQLHVPIEDGMKVVVRATPKVTNRGKFSLTVQTIRLVGEGALKRSFELLKEKLEKEGLFAEERKRILPAIPKHIAVISSVQAAGYADFVKILNDRWGGVRVDVAHVQVQGERAADQIIRAIQYFNGRDELPEVLVVIRGGGSADDLSVFNNESLVREIARSRIPTVVGVGHEVDVTLADMVADVRAATPSNAAQIIVPDRYEIQRLAHSQVVRAGERLEYSLEQTHQYVVSLLEHAIANLDERIQSSEQILSRVAAQLQAYDPEAVLARGYAIVRGSVAAGNTVSIERTQDIIMAEVIDVKRK